MELSWFDLGLWIAGFAGHLALLFVLMAKGRWRAFPIFTAIIGFSAFRTILLYFMYRYSSEGAYAIVYGSADLIDLALQVALVFEIARIVLKPTGTWIRDAYLSFVIWGVFGGVIAAVLTFAVNPKVPDHLDGWIETGHFFAILLLAELFASMMVTSSRLGLVWRNHVMGLGQGLTLWAIVSLIVETFRSYYGEDWHAVTLDHIRMVSYLCAILYWMITFWISEPERRTLSPEMQEYLSGLGKKAGRDYGPPC